MSPTRRIAACAFLLYASPCVVAREVDNPGWSLVAASSANGQLLLTTAKRNGIRTPREVRLPESGTPQSVHLSRTGTKAAVLIGEKVHVADLTAEIAIWDRCRHLHTLSGLQYAVVLPNEIVVFADDVLTDGCVAQESRAPLAERGTSEWMPLKTLRGHVASGKVLSIPTQSLATSVAIDAGGAVLYVDAQRQIHRYRAGRDSTISLPAAWTRMAPMLGFADPQNSSRGFQVVLRDENGFRIARLGPDADELKPGLSLSPESQKEISALMAPKGGGNWTLFHVEPDPYLYQPVLEMDQYEKVYPTTIDIWKQYESDNDLRNMAAILAKYQYLSPKQKRCTVYYEIRSYPGSWLIEYWTYYLADLGGLAPHPHDSEHTFVEIDKVGGQPRAILSAAHHAWDPNNQYSSLAVEGAEVPQLPLFVFVEYGKHAMAPDINHDGIVTFGRDVNTYRERAHVWGIRDYIGSTDAHTSRWTGDMAVPRVPRNWLLTERFHKYFGKRVKELGIDESSYSCGLAPFVEVTEAAPAVKPEKRATSGSDYLRQAAWELEKHSDHQNPEAIYRPHVFPDTSVRLGTEYNFLERTPLVSAAFATSLMRPLGLNSWIPLPGRVAAEYLVGMVNTTRDVWVDVLGPNNTITRRSAKVAYERPWSVGVRYEKMATNLFGFEVGVHRMFQKARPEVGFENLHLNSSFWCYRAGLMAVVQRLTVQAGPVWTDNTSRGIGFELRVSGDLWSARGRRKFGIP